ncbi:LOW QUALITY PROTEIN: pneumococcal serine-rich repeat protein [Drosophila ficusphila]|uniref:LOW QUALITY PROTEIN: pneumococcal serine-rich repeat protein n=1 Tax=Drosophila ficusphila TaxID=30025 RepID=UPI0007E86A0D|nr:LOW QUALITY PROTEIN: pneumococcal serine-rich repeat protein [Drosophila ficusphila]
MPGSRMPRPPFVFRQQQDPQRSTERVIHPWASVVEQLNRIQGEEQLVRRSGSKSLKCQTSDSTLANSISNATGSGGESESANKSAQLDAVYSGSGILCSVNSANNTRKLNLILSRSQQRRRREPLAVGTNLQNKLPASSADCHLSPSAETSIRASPPRSPPSPHSPLNPLSSPCPYSSRCRRGRSHRHRHHHHYRHRGCRCRCRDASHSASASASPASMLLPYQINQRATLLQQSAAAATTATATTATSTTLPHVPRAAATSLRAVPRIFKRKRDTVRTATTASPLTPQQHPTVAAAATVTSVTTATSATTATSTTTTRRSRLEFILYTEVYEVEGDSVSPNDSQSKSNVGSSQSFWQKYGE